MQEEHDDYVGPRDFVDVFVSEIKKQKDLPSPDKLFTGEYLIIFLVECT